MNGGARPINNPKDKTYSKEMLEDVIQAQSSGKKISSAPIPDDIPQNLSRGAHRPEKKELVAQLRGRFGRKDT